MIKSQEEKELESLFTQQKVTPEYFSLVVHVYKERVYWLVRKIVLTHEDANDVTQEVFIRIWEKKHQFNGNSRLFTWIYRIATNMALEHLRKNKNKNHSSLSDGVEDRIFQLQADTYFSGDDAELKFQKALLTLPEKQRMVFQLKYFEELKYEEISQILDTSVGALKASYHHANEKLKAFLKAVD